MLAFFFSTRVSRKMLDPIQNHITARSKLQSLRSHISRPCCVTLPKISLVQFFSLHPLVPTALNPGETFSVFFLDPVQRISTRSYVSQCQLIYSVRVSRKMLAQFKATLLRGPNYLRSHISRPCLVTLPKYHGWNFSPCTPGSG